MKEKEYKKAIEYKPENEERLEGVKVESCKHIFGLVTVNESNIGQVGYIKEERRLFINYKYWRKSVEGFVIGYDLEPFGYFYEDVDESVFNQLIKSKDKVKFIEDNIKGKYLYHREEVWN